MPGDKKEPQSYGSDADWVSGKTGQNVNPPKSAPPPEHADFYDDRRESESNEPPKGGSVSPIQLAENQQPTGPATGPTSPVTGITTSETGAKRDSYFKKRDYE